MLVGVVLPIRLAVVVRKGGTGPGAAPGGSDLAVGQGRHRRVPHGQCQRHRLHLSARARVTLDLHSPCVGAWRRGVGDGEFYPDGLRLVRRHVEAALGRGRKQGVGPPAAPAALVPWRVRGEHEPDLEHARHGDGDGDADDGESYVREAGRRVLVGPKPEEQLGGLDLAPLRGYIDDESLV